MTLLRLISSKEQVFSLSFFKHQSNTAAPILCHILSDTNNLK